MRIEPATLVDHDDVCALDWAVVGALDRSAALRGSPDRGFFLRAW
jgi:hypothetical protein